MNADCFGDGERADILHFSLDNLVSHFIMEIVKETRPKPTAGNGNRGSENMPASSKS